MNLGFGRPWSAAEQATLRELWPEHPAAEVASALNRSCGSVFKQAGRLGLKKRRLWTPEEDLRLTKLWGEVSVTTIGERLGRSGLTVYWRAQKLGLPLGCPEGFEYLGPAAARAGFTAEALVRVLRWAEEAGIVGGGGRPVLRRAVTRPSRSKRAAHARIVDPIDVDDAVAAWVRSETIQTAADRVGVDAEKLRWVVATFAVGAPPQPAPRNPWRVPSDVIDGAVAAWRSRESLKQAARRVGLARDTLARRLKAAAVDGTHGRPWQLVPRDVDAAIGRAA